MNAFQMVRPRGKDMPSKAPAKRKPAAGNITFKGTTRVLNAAGQWQAYLKPSVSIVIEDSVKGRASAERRRIISRAAA